jgi:hypothetical protein
MSMREDPIVAEVREARRKILERHNYDLHALFRELKEHERARGKPLTKGKARRLAQSE